jgi:hypothetical protein
MHALISSKTGSALRLRRRVEPVCALAARAFVMPNHAKRRVHTVLFGAFDRHNFGDLLFPHIVARMLAPSDVLYAGLVTRDLRAWGGHAPCAFANLGAWSRGKSLNVIHVGGELLTCNAWEAAVMLARPERVRTMIAEEKQWRRDPLAWAMAHLGTASRAPYIISTASFPRVCVNTTSFHAVGGTDLDRREPSFRNEVLSKLRRAAHLSVRDRQTQAHLRAANIEAPLVPDPVVMVAELFGARIQERAAGDAVKPLRDAYPQGYAALQFDASFGDDATLDVLAYQIGRAAKTNRLGVVMFRAGAAPWHDDLDVYRRLAARLRGTPVHLFTSLYLWDICALIAYGRVYCGSSLHGRIVAMAFARPRVNLVHASEAQQSTKQAAFAATWEPQGIAATTVADGLADAIGTALETDVALMRHTAADMARRYRLAFCV